MSSLQWTNDQEKVQQNDRFDHFSQKELWIRWEMPPRGNTLGRWTRTCGEGPWVTDGAASTTRKSGRRRGIVDDSRETKTEESVQLCHLPHVQLPMAAAHPGGVRGRRRRHPRLRWPVAARRGATVGGRLLVRYTLPAWSCFCTVLFPPFSNFRKYRIQHLLPTFGIVYSSQLISLCYSYWMPNLPISWSTI